MKRMWQILNILSVIFALAMNFLVGAQVLSLPGINEISDKYATLLTPASYAFSIWSLVYLLLIAFAVYQARDLFKPQKDNDLPQKVGPLFVIANVCNGLWAYIFVQEYVALSVLVLLALAASLYVLIYRLNIAKDNAPLKTIAFVWWPLLIYAGWVTVASVVNIASWFDSMGVEIVPFVACLVLVILAAALLWLLVTRNVRELLLASTWGIIAIGVEQFTDSRAVAVTALAVSALLLIATMIHAYRNRHESPFKL